MATEAMSLTYKSWVKGVETLGSTPAALDASAKVTHTEFDTEVALTGTTTVPVSKCAYFEQALTAGAATVDLTALVGSNAGAENMTGLKVQAAKFIAPATNTGPITVAVGASNGYNLLGANTEFAVSPGQEVTILGNDATPDVGASAKTLDLTGTGTEKLQIAIVAG